MAGRPTRNRNEPKPDLRDASRGQRLAKALAAAGVASRRAVEQMVEEGRISVNGDTVRKLPAWVNLDTDRVEVDGRRVATPGRGHTWLMVHKPRGVICTSSDDLGRPGVVDLVPHTQRLFCVGRLDAESTGLVLLSDDGELANRLTHPRYEVDKTYEVTVRGTVSGEQLSKLEKGIILADKRGSTAKARAAEVVVIDGDRERTRLRITLREGRNREIRRMAARIGLNVRRLKRIAIGPLRLKGVAAGAWRPLTRGEVAALRRAAHG